MKSPDKCEAPYCRKPFNYMVTIKNSVSLDPIVRQLCGWHAHDQIQSPFGEVLKVTGIEKAKE